MASVHAARRLIQMAQDSMELYEHRRLTLSELAAASHISYNTLSRIMYYSVGNIHAATYQRLKAIIEGRYLH